MKTIPFYMVRRIGVAVSCLSLIAGSADAKPDKGKDKGGGPPGHSQKGKPDKGQAGKPDKPGGKEFRPDKAKPDLKGADKRDKELRKLDKDVAKADAKWREHRFREAERDSVISYFAPFRDNEHGLPPGLAMNLRRGKALPPGWQKKITPGYVFVDDDLDLFQALTYDLFPGLTPVPDTRLYRVGDRIVRVYEPRREVIDVIHVPTIRLP